MHQLKGSSRSEVERADRTPASRAFPTVPPLIANARYIEPVERIKYVEKKVSRPEWQSLTIFLGTMIGALGVVFLIMWAVFS